MDEKIARPNSAGYQEEVRPTKNRGDLVLSDLGSKHEQLLTYQCYDGQEEVRPTKEGVMWLPSTVAQLVVLLVDPHHRPPQLVGQASFGGDTKQGGIKADIQARAKLDNQAKSLLMSRFDRFILLSYGLSTSS